MTPPPIPWAPMAWSLAMLACWAGIARCQDRQPTEVLIARTLISEEGFDGAEGWASLGAVIRWRAENPRDPSSGPTWDRGDVRAATVALSPALHGERCQAGDPSDLPGRPWRCDLSDDLHEPEGLGATWTRERPGGRPSRRDAWEAALEAARAILSGSYPDACRETPHAWGSMADVALRLAAGERWDDAGCPGRNRYGRRLVRR